MPAKTAEDIETMTDDQIHEAIMRLIESGKLEIQIDDSDIRKEIATTGKTASEQANRLSGLVKTNFENLAKEIGQRPTAEAVSAALGKALDGFTKDVDAKLSEVVRKAKGGDVKFDEAKLRQIADEVTQGVLTTKIAQQLSTGEKTPLPPLLKVDPFFVENAQTDRIELCLDTRRHGMASGPSGSGKTYPIEQVLRKRGLRYLKVSVADGLTLSDFLCRANVRAGDKGTETYYTYGFLPFAMLNGLALVLDEIDQCQPEVVSILNAALESRSVYIPQTGETITAKPEWQVFMTCNTLRDSTGNYAGFRLNAALLNRVVFIKADYLEAKEENGILQRVGLTQKDAATIVGLMQGLRNAYNGGKLTQAPSTRIAVRIARCVLGQDDDGNKVTKPMKLDEAFAFCLLDGLPDSEVTEAKAVLSNGL